MLVFYWLEPRSAIFSLGFAISCWSAAAYGWLAGAWPFAVVELVWGGVAVGRYARRRTARTPR
jgi:16S rRNA (adenine(1408)-N(1))-methyltransferase